MGGLSTRVGQRRNGNQTADLACEGPCRRADHKDYLYLVYSPTDFPLQDIPVIATYNE